MDEKENAQRPAESAQAPVPPLAPPPIDPPPAAESPAPKGDQSGEKMGKSDLIMSIATVVIALRTLVSAAAIVLQWREMVNGGADTAAIKVAAQQQASAAQQFADAAASINAGIGNAVKKLDAQAQVSKGTLDEIKATDRAFIFVQKVTTVVVADGNFAWDATFENSGTTPTRNLLIWINCGFGGQFGNPISMDNAGRGFPGMIGPRSTHEVIRCAAMAQFTHQHAWDGWYVYGYARYDDVFGKHHLTEFCWQNLVLGNPGEDPHMVACINPGATQFNCADKECADYGKRIKSAPIRIRHYEPREKSETIPIPPTESGS